MDLLKLAEPLTVDQIDFRIQSINKGGYATILAYKNARCDMQRLDDVCGPLNWERKHTRDNKNCTVSIYNEESNQWVGKEDTGTESNAEAQKGLASDSFKRSCFNWGIGRELYEYPVIQIKLNPKEFKVDNNKVMPTWELKLKEWVWYSEFEDGKISFLAASDGVATRYKWGLMKSTEVIDDVIVEPIETISNEPLDLDKVSRATTYFINQINADEDEDAVAPRIKAAYNRLTNDEQVAVNNNLKEHKFEKRQLNTILKGFLEYECN